MSETELDNVTDAVVGENDTETFGPDDQFEKNFAALGADDVGDDHPIEDASVDDGAPDEDISSEPQSSFDENALRLEQLRNMAVRNGVDARMVDTFKSPEALEGFLYGYNMRTPQGQTPGQTNGNGRQLPALEFNLEDVDEPLRNAFGTVSKFGSGINDRFLTYDQQMQQYQNVLLMLAERQDHIFRMQQDAAVNRYISGLDDEVQSVFKDRKAQQQLRDEMETLQVGRRQRNLPELPDDELIRRGVALVAFQKVKQVERDRLAKAQAKRAKAVSPKPSSAKTTERDIDPEAKALDDLYAANVALARKYGRGG